MKKVETAQTTLGRTSATKYKGEKGKEKHGDIHNVMFRKVVACLLVWFCSVF